MQVEAGVDGRRSRVTIKQVAEQAGVFARLGLPQQALPLAQDANPAEARVSVPR